MCVWRYSAAAAAVVVCRNVEGWLQEEMDRM
jgi:hypothetical protein